MPQVNLGPQYDLAQRLSSLEDQMRRLQQNPYGQGFSSSQSDGSIGLTIGQYGGGSGATALQFFQGPNTARDPNTNQHPVMLYIGQLAVGGTLEDNGVLMFYPTGQQLAALGQDGLVLSDPSGNVIVSNDQTTHQGLARPWIPLPTPASSHFTHWPFINGSGLMAECFFNGQHPKVWWNASVAADAGVTGTVTMTVTNPAGSVSSATYTYSGTQVNIDTVLAVPGPFFNQVHTVQINGQVTGGTGNLYCQTWALMGRQS